MPTGTPAGRRTRRRAPVLGDARASSGSSKGQWGRSPLRGPPRDTVQRPGPCRKSPALLCVMRALPNSSTGGNAYTLSVHKRTHRYVHTDPMSKRVTDIHANVCTHTRGHTHTHTIEVTGRHCCPSDITGSAGQGGRGVISALQRA